MRIQLVAVGTRLPQWQQQGFQEYARRLPKECAMQLTEIPAAARAKSKPTKQAIQKESERMLAAVDKSDYVVALDQPGTQYSSENLSALLAAWLAQGRHLSMLIGGADGLSDACRSRADLRWSLSDMTLPHGLVRVMVAEQMYRAWSILHGHPYHRGE
ncbi:MAG: 23S rRNA (pseudouridine(1915)-N(3))-methyltransferase RlmH [Gammaproteobacteria bacterium]|jgi:23S rRNA (pseudouridine1915-N3)-methyltransferase|nr:23S rRNA (pseudouridine(1915)-N(3))-methyltransferase RlmH [Gammaproteobacteria bacterium]MDX2460193.1 23S rRNA (pseudouridine(1915)-N(3))-methyltransferase RlmH [Gammaproteobacteria bacterium]